MKIYLAADHAGFEMKESVKKYLEVKGHDVTDFGAHEFNDSDDYQTIFVHAQRLWRPIYHL